MVRQPTSKLASEKPRFNAEQGEKMLLTKITALVDAIAFASRMGTCSMVGYKEVFVYIQLKISNWRNMAE